jgi:hypothetical protein
MLGRTFRAATPCNVDVDEPTMTAPIDNPAVALFHEVATSVAHRMYANNTSSDGEAVQDAS